MNVRFIFCFFILLHAGMLPAQNKSQPVAVIFDSDMGPDYDDVGAIAMLHAYADSGYVKILATIASTRYEGVAAVFEVFNIYFNRPDIPIGVPKGRALALRDPQHWTDSILRKYPHGIRHNSEVPDAVTLYRKILAAQPDKSVTIITVGFLTNLAGLLNSKPDEYSPMNGRTLVGRKVRQLVCMAGKFPSGSEFNVNQDAAASRVVFENWNTPVLLSGFEIGDKIKSGLPLIKDSLIKNSPVKDVFRISIPLSVQDSAGRMSWDETAVLVAVKGYKPWYKVKKGKILVAEDGSNQWAEKPQVHMHLVEALSHEVVEKLINRVIMHQPVLNRRP